MNTSGICGRGVLVDLVKFYTDNGTKPLPYDPWTAHSVPVKDIKAAAQKQGIEFRTGDILLLRMGFIQVHAQPCGHHDNMHTNLALALEISIKFSC